MDADFMALGDDLPLLVGMQQSGDRRDIEAGLDPVLFQRLQNARDADTVTELAPGEPPDRVAAVAQIAGLVIAVKRQCHGTAGAARPFRWPQFTPGAHPVDAFAPFLFGPLPGFEIGALCVHAVFSSSMIWPEERRLIGELVGAVRFELTTLSTPC